MTGGREGYGQRGLIPRTLHALFEALRALENTDVCVQARKAQPAALCVSVSWSLAAQTPAMRKGCSHNLTVNRPAA